MSIDDGEMIRLQEEIARLQVMNAGLRAMLTKKEGGEREEPNATPPTSTEPGLGR